MPGRKYSAGSGYRYGFNGKEKDNETYGDGNQFDYGNRVYNPRVGVWLSVDKLQARHPGESPYLFSGANPVIYNDPDGKDRILRIYSVDKNGVKSLVSEQTIKKGVFDEGQDAQGFFYRQDIVNELTIDANSSNSMNTSYRNRELYAFRWQRTLANKMTDIGNFISSNSEGSGSYQEAGYSFSGGSGSTLEFRDKAGNYLGNVDLGTLFSFFTAANLTAEGVETLFKKFGDESALEKIALFGEKVNTFIEAGETSTEAIQSAKEFFEKKEAEAQKTISPSSPNSKQQTIQQASPQSKAEASRGKELKTEPDSIIIHEYRKADGTLTSPDSGYQSDKPKTIVNPNKKKGGKNG